MPAFFTRFGLTYRLVFKTSLGVVFKFFALFAFEFFFEFLGFFCFGLGELISHSEFFQSAATGQLDAIAVIDVDDLNLHLIAHLADVINTANVAAGEFADVAQPIASGQDFDERAEVLNAADSTDVNLADLNGSGGQFDALQRLLGHSRVVRSDCHLARVIDVDHGLGLFLNCTDVLATRTDQHANLLWVDLATAERTEKCLRLAG
jgi:hypothetical protein